MSTLLGFTFLTLLILTTSASGNADTQFMLGAAVHDITGPPAEVMFAGYCDFDQVGRGIFMRQRARTIIIQDIQTDKRVVLVTADIPMMSDGVYATVINKLRNRFGNLYTEANVVISATHTHSGPGGYFKTYALNIFAGMTFHEDNFDTIVQGIYASIVQAHGNLTPGEIRINSGFFSPEKGTRINRQRSPEAYVLNRDAPDYLLASGAFDDTNRKMTQLKLVAGDGTPMGMYNWTPVHPNVSGSHLFLINGDINGYASYLFEKSGTPFTSANNGFIAAFAQNDCADTSGNLPEDALLFTDIHKDGEEDWIADGTHDYERVALRAKTVAGLAAELYDGNGTVLTGNIDYRQIFVPMKDFLIDPAYIDAEDIYYADRLGETQDNCRLCGGSAGVGFFAGSTEDGDSGMVNVGEGNTRDIDDYRIASLSDLIQDPIPAVTNLLMQMIVPGEALYAEMDCQMEKQIGLSLDELNRIIPNGKAWNLNVPIQIIRIGELAILTLPLEVSTMAGRRLKDEIKSVLPDTSWVVINATANSDARYLTTREEYAAQQYEGGATLLGPYSLNAVRQIVHELAETFTPSVDYPDYAVGFEAFERDLETRSIFQISGNVIFDDKPLFKRFGDVIEQPPPSRIIGDMVTARFQGAHPNNNMAVATSESYLAVEKKIDGIWKPVLDDHDPSTRYLWQRDGIANSIVTIEWHIPMDTEPGTYRIRHMGRWKSGWTGQIKRYEGLTRSFEVY
ncbi:MAG: neutral/alkaline non-lysosomal ceramidase N-terminal domain-containing protein [Desulfobacterium sp.]|nr:neutral/alkaline non-lysosomal ceramidase N-terminal domain-containing protein [Desulfobacterium sp.]